MQILVLGGYGLIGSAILRRLVTDGHEVTGLGRSRYKGEAVSTQADWVEADISRLTQPADWANLIAGHDVVVNASGALQSGLKDNVSAVQETAILALIKACENEGVSQFIQISAPGVSESSDTEFYRTKAAADAALTSSNLANVIFRPGLVISSQAYGGTSLLRMLAAFPLVQPLVYSDTSIKTVWVEDVANAVSSAIKQRLPKGDFDLVADEPVTLGGTVSAFRAWLGFRPAKAILSFPVILSALIAKGADIAGWLGWRSALRTTSLKVLAKGIEGDCARWENCSGQRLRTLGETLNAIPATAQERVYARTMLAFPFLLITLSLFWIASGLIGLWQVDAARAILGDQLPPTVSSGFVLGGATADIMIGLCLLVRPWTRIAALASIGLSIGYLIGSAVITPHLWADPIGPMVKVFPAMALAVAIAAMAETR